MNREDIIAMAREAGIGETSARFMVNLWEIGFEAGAAAERKRSEQEMSMMSEHCAELILIEREACAKVCDEKVDAEYATGKVDHNEMGWTQACAAAIRARGQA